MFLAWANMYTVFVQSFDGFNLLGSYTITPTPVVSPSVYTLMLLFYEDRLFLNLYTFSCFSVFLMPSCFVYSWHGICQIVQFTTQTSSWPWSCCSNILVQGTRTVARSQTLYKSYWYVIDMCSKWYVWGKLDTQIYDLVTFAFFGFEWVSSFPLFTRGTFLWKSKMWYLKKTPKWLHWFSFLWYCHLLYSMYMTLKHFLLFVFRYMGHWMYICRTSNIWTYIPL